MKRIEIHTEMDETTLAARKELVDRLKQDPRIIQFLQREKQDGRFLEENAGALGRYVDSLDLCRNCPGLQLCRQPMKGRGLSMHVQDGILEETYVPCRLQQTVQDRRQHRENYRIYHGDPKDLELSMKGISMAGETPEYMNCYIEAMRTAAEDGGIFLYGQPGTGKTYLLTALANDFARQDLKVSFVKVPLFVQDFRQSLDDPDYRHEMLGHLKFSDVLFLDDLGSEGISKWTRDDILFPVLDYRMQNGKKTYFSSNYTPAELLEKYQPDGDRVASLRLQERLQSLARPVKMAGPSRRKSRT